MELVVSYLNLPANIRKQARVWFVEGSPLFADDLDRVRYKTCAAAFLLPNIFAQDLEREDVGNVMRALVMKRHTSYIRVSVILMKADSVSAMLAVGVAAEDCLAFDELTHSLLGKGADVQGFLCLAGSMHKASRTFDTQDLAAAARWVEDFTPCLKATVHEVDLTDAYYKVPFSECASELAERNNYKAFLIGLLEEPVYPADPTNFLLFPHRNYMVGGSDDRMVKGIFIAKSKDDISQAPAGKKINWSRKVLMEKEEVEGQQVTLEAIQSGLIPASSLAHFEQEGWVKDNIGLKDDRDTYIGGRIRVAALRRVVTGLRMRAKLSKVGIEEVIEEKDPEIFELGDDMELKLQQVNFEDPTEKAIMKFELKAWKEIDADRRSYDPEAFKDVDLGEAERFQKAMNRIIQYEEDLIRRSQVDRITREEDDRLWGGPPAPPETQGWAAPEEPTEDTLLRGGHTILLSLESEMNAPMDIADDGGFKRKPLAAGRKTFLRHFIQSHRSANPLKRRTIVVVSNRVPLDWDETAAEGHVFLVQGRPLCAETLFRAGLLQARVVVIQNRDCLSTNEALLVDSEAAFALRLVESLLQGGGKGHIPVLVDLQLHENTVLLKEDKTVPKPKALQALLEPKDEDEGEVKKVKEEKRYPPLLLQQRFASGVVFSHNLVVHLLANMMYQTSLGAVAMEMARAAFVVIAVPENWRGLLFGQLYAYLLKKRNLMPMALLRRSDVLDELDAIDAALENRRAAYPDDSLNQVCNDVAAMQRKLRKANQENNKPKWQENEDPFNRYTLVMPLEVSFVLPSDGIICMKHTKSVMVNIED